MNEEIAYSTSPAGNGRKRSREMFALMIREHEVRERVTSSVEVVHRAIVSR